MSYRNELNSYITRLHRRLRCGLPMHARSCAVALHPAGARLGLLAHEIPVATSRSRDLAVDVCAHLPSAVRPLPAPARTVSGVRTTGNELPAAGDTPWARNRS